MLSETNAIPSFSSATPHSLALHSIAKKEGTPSLGLHPSGKGSMKAMAREGTFRARSGIHALLEEAREEHASMAARKLSALDASTGIDDAARTNSFDSRIPSPGSVPIPLPPSHPRGIRSQLRSSSFNRTHKVTD